MISFLQKIEDVNEKLTFSNVKVGQPFKADGVSYMRTFPMKSSDGSIINAVNEAGRLVTFEEYSPIDEIYSGSYVIKII